jgi:hypothetical protein
MPATAGDAGSDRAILEAPGSIPGEGGKRCIKPGGAPTQIHDRGLPHTKTTQKFG